MIYNEVIKNRVFAPDTLNWKQIQFVKRSVPEASFLEWIQEEFDFITAYHGCRPQNVALYYKNGFYPSDFNKTRMFFEEHLAEQYDYQPYKLQTIFDLFDGDSNQYVHFLLDKNDFRHCSHYLIYGSELLLSLAEAVNPRIKFRLSSLGIPTIFRCNIPISIIEPQKLTYLFPRFMSSKGNLEEKKREIFSNYGIPVAGPVSPLYIVGHEHPINKLKDYHAKCTYQNETAFCPVCQPL